MYPKYWSNENIEATTVGWGEIDGDGLNLKHRLRKEKERKGEKSHTTSQYSNFVWFN